jgi:hypothetical protein
MEASVLSDRATSVKSQVASTPLPILLPVPQLRPADWAGMTKTERGFLGADVAKGYAALPDPTVADIAERLGVSTAYVYAAMRCTPEERAAVLLGARPLVPEDLDRAWAQADEATRARHVVKVADYVGPDRLLDLAADRETKHANGNGHANGTAAG